MLHTDKQLIDNFFDTNVYIPLYKGLIFMINEASAVMSAFSGKTTPQDEFYHLRMVYGAACGIVAAVTVGPVFIMLFSIQLALSAMIAAASMLVHGLSLAINHGLQGIDDILSPLPHEISFHV